ncbi:MAG: hypothetical protein GXO35_06200, partial [Gammaproteobacteria bacterium]|nr:hypothetical protein [Gammaproteobacteria bacterium]
MKNIQQLPFIDLIAPEQRAVFSGCTKAVSQQRSFEDSTHLLWRCMFKDELHFLKVCRAQKVHESGFWQGVERLFQFDLSRSLMHYDLVYAQIAAFSPLRIPSLFSSGDGSVALDGAEFSGFLITEFLEGQVIDENTVSASMVQQLTAHVVCLHRVKQSRFGALFNIEEVLGEQAYASTDWLHQLSGFLIEQGEMQGLSGTAWFGDALSAL